MEKILISACLVGDKTNYQGKSNYNPDIEKLLEKYELVPFCPEVEGGLSTPRTPSEIVNDKVINQKGIDVTKYFLAGAEKAYTICSYLGIKKVILKDNSPSCGVKHIYNGKFSHTLIKGKGITAEYLSKKGISLYTEEDIPNLLTEESNTNN